MKSLHSPTRGVLAIAAASALVLAGCAGGGSDGSEAGSGSGGGEGLPETIKISVVVPTTGPVGTFGQQVVEGVEAGVHYIEEEGVLGDSTIELDIQDTGSQANTSASLTQSATRADAVAIVGSPISNEALAAGPIANSAEVPYLATTAPGPHLPELGDYVFSMSTPQSVLLLEYLGRLVETEPKVSVIYASDNDTTVNLNDALNAEITELGGELVNNVSTTLTATDYRVVATKAMEGSPDAIGVLSGGPQLPALVSELRALGFDGRVFANGGADVSAPAAGSAVDGLEFQGQWAPNVDAPMSVPFADAMAAVHPDSTPHYPAVDGFNSIRLIAEGLAEADSTDGPALLAGMHAVVEAGFESPGGTVEFTGDSGRQLQSPVFDLVINDGIVSVLEN